MKLKLSVASTIASGGFRLYGVDLRDLRGYLRSTEAENERFGPIWVGITLSEILCVTLHDALFPATFGSLSLS